MPKSPQNKTQPTDVDPQSFVAGISNKTRQSDAQTLISVLQDLTGEPAVMWGPSIIGFGEHRYTLASGQESRLPRLGFSPRSAHLVFYLALSHPKVQQCLAGLGKHKTSKACLYVNKLADIDLDVLREIFEISYQNKDL